MSAAKGMVVGEGGREEATGVRKARLSVLLMALFEWDWPGEVGLVGRPPPGPA